MTATKKARAERAAQAQDPHMLAFRLWRACCDATEATRPVAPNEWQSGEECDDCGQIHMPFGRLPMAVRQRIAASCGTDERTAREILPLR